jgi:endonuclease-3
MVKKIIKGPIGSPKVKADWEAVYSKISKMRSKMTAPVDIEGAATLGEDADPKTFRFQTLVGLMLSSQTRDPVTAKKMRFLIDKGLSINSILQTSESDLANDLYGVSFHNNKAKFLKKTAVILNEKYDDDVPGDFKIVSQLPGVGPKMTHLFLQICYDKVEGIAVDTHVHRVSNRLGWVNTKNPLQTMNALEKMLPKEKWAEVNEMLVGFGQMHCKPIGPLCHLCDVRDSCPTGKQNLKKNKKNK